MTKRKVYYDELIVEVNCLELITYWQTSTLITCLRFVSFSGKLTTNFHSDLSLKAARGVIYIVLVRQTSSPSRLLID